jgi:hypothetical protein
MNETKYPCALITRAYRGKYGTTYRAFAEALNEHLVNSHISHASVANWEKGITDPETDFLLVCLVVHDDWRAEWAIDCLCAKLPEVFDRHIDGRLIVLSKRIAASVMSSY